MYRRHAIRVATLSALLAGALPAAAAAQGGTWALTNARIETVTHGVIERGTIVIRDGLIAAVGANVTLPADARVLDLAGRTVVPGLIDLTSTLGVPAPPAPTGGGPAAAAALAAARQAGAGPAFVGLEPERLVVEDFRPQAADVRAAREAGITAVLSAPSRGAFRGRSALMPTRDSVLSRHAIRTPVALHMGFQGAQGQYPATLLGVIAYERQAFYDAQRHALLSERYRQNPRGMERPAHDPGLEALAPAVRGDLPVFFAADNENEIRRAVGIAREFNLQMTIVGATEAFRVVDVLQATRRPVVVAVDFPRPTSVTGWQYRGAMRRPLNDSAVTDSAVRRMVEGNAAALNRAGVRFALASGGTRPADFLSNVRKAVAAGLPRDTALAALTIRPAELAGVGQQLGSIEEGKVANLVVTQGDILSDTGRVRMVFVDGYRYEVQPPARAAGPAGRGPGGPGGAAAAAMAGTWDLTLSTPQGSQVVTMNVTVSGSGFTGTMTSPMGTSDISGGTVDGSRVRWSMSLTMGGQTMTIDYEATLQGNRMSGTASLGQLGSFPFTAEKRP